MDDAGAQHAHDLPHQRGVIVQSLLLREDQVIESWRGVAVCIGEEFHQHHALEKTVGPGNAHACGT